ncbi:MAG: hypothetical protein K9G10_02725 [Rhodoluna sp.]|nr:hypothetical protein [Rhodoluna sp.]
MSKDPYKIVNSKPGWASKLASGGIAIGSVATAIVITVPGLPGYETLSQALASGTQQGVTNPNGSSQGSQANSTSPSDVPGQTLIGSSAVANDPKVSTSAKVLGSSIKPTLSSSKLTLSGISTANTSSPTPLASAYSSAATGSQTSGNVSSPTPSGSTVGYEDDDYEDDEYEDDEEDD